MNINGSLSIVTVPSGSSATEIMVYNTTGGIVERRSTLPQASIVNLVTDLANKQPLSSRLTAWDAYNTNGVVVQTSATTWINRTIVGPAAGLFITNANFISGNPTIALANDLAALEALATSGIAVRTGTDTWALRQLIQPAAGIVIVDSNGVGNNPTFTLANDLAALEGLGSTGIAVRTATDTWAQRTITGTASQIIVTNGNGVSGNPTISLDPAVISGSSLWRPGSSGTNNIRDTFGFSNTTGNNSIVFGGTSVNNNSSASDNTAVIAGFNNVIASGGNNSIIIGGTFNNIIGSNNSAIIGGTSKTIAGNYSVDLGGDSGGIQANNSVNLGGNNNAIIVGGNNSVTMGQFCVVSGNASFAGGFGSTVFQKNTVSGPYSFSFQRVNAMGTYGVSVPDSAIIGGLSNIINGGSQGGILAGYFNTVSSQFSVILGGQSNTASAGSNASMISGVNTTTTEFGERAYGIGNLSSLNAQCGDLILSNVTSNATNTGLTTGAGLDGINIPVGTAWVFDFVVSGTITSATNRSNTRVWFGKYLIKNVAGTLVQSVVQTIVPTTGETGTTAFSLTANTFTGTRYRFVVKGAASTNVSWMANIKYTKVQFA